jgi:chloramphenicol 3-O phosphotransferase
MTSSSSGSIVRWSCWSSEKQSGGDRPNGSARQDYETIHIGKAYDIDLHTTDDLDDNVEALLAAWRSGGRASSFRRD